MPPIYVTKNGQQHGPFTMEELDEMLQAETFTGEDLYWHQGADGWKPISQLPGYVPAPQSNAAPAAASTGSVPRAMAPPMPATPPKHSQVDPVRSKEDYVKRIRSSSTYPTFRSLIGLFALLFYVAGVLWIVGAVIGGVSRIADGESQSVATGIALVIGGLIVGLVYIVIGKVFKEASLMLADIADTLLERHSRED